MVRTTKRRRQSEDASKDAKSTAIVSPSPSTSAGAKETPKRGKAAKAKASNAETGKELGIDEDGEKLWEVEKVLSRRLVSSKKKGKKRAKEVYEYLVVWKDCDDPPTWYPESCFPEELLVGVSDETAEKVAPAAGKQKAVPEKKPPAKKTASAAKKVAPKGSAQKVAPKGSTQKKRKIEQESKKESAASNEVSEVASSRRATRSKEGEGNQASDVASGRRTTRSKEVEGEPKKVEGKAKAKADEKKGEKSKAKAKTDEKKGEKNKTDSKKGDKKVVDKKKKGSAADDGDDEVEEEFYEIETVIDYRRNSKGKEEYRVKWVGYDYEDKTWYPAENLTPEAMEDAMELKKRKAAKKPDSETTEAGKRKSVASAKKADTSAKKADTEVAVTGNRKAVASVGTPQAKESKPKKSPQRKTQPKKSQEVAAAPSNRESRMQRNWREVTKCPGCGLKFMSDLDSDHCPYVSQGCRHSVCAQCLFKAKNEAKRRPSCGWWPCPVKQCKVVKAFPSEQPPRPDFSLCAVISKMEDWIVNSEVS